MATETANPLYPRKRAKESGFKVYHRPAACELCGTHARYTSSSGCVECDRRTKAARLADPGKAADIRAKGNARAAAFRERQRMAKAAAQPAAGRDEFGDILG